MNFRHIVIVFKKEMKDCFRDKKSVISNILLPLILIPAIYFLMNMMIKGNTKEIQENMKIGIVYQKDISKAEAFTKDSIVGQDKAEIITYTTEEQATESLMNGNLNCVIIYSDEFFNNIEKNIISNVKLKYDSTRNTSQLGMQIISSKLSTLNTNLAQKRLEELNIPKDVLSLIAINVEDAYVPVTDNSSNGANEILIVILPMYLATVIVSSGMPLALDLFAGERERNTFEALFSTKANRLSILIGKYISVLVFSIISIFTSFIGLILGIALNPEMFTNNVENFNVFSLLSSMNIPISALLLVLLSSITLAIVFGGIQIAISTYSKSLKGAQTYLSYLVFVGMVPGFMSMSMGAGDMQNFMAFIPVFNTIASIKMVLSGIINYGFLIWGVVTNLVFSGLISAWVIKMFNKEKIIIR